jgi:hypothetical protein
MSSKGRKQLTFSLLILLLVSFFGCKKTPLTPDAEDLTRPVIWLSSFELSFTASETGANPTTQALGVKNSGQKTLNYTLSDDAAWLSVEPASGSSSGSMVEHMISVDKSGLAAQETNYTATITITSSEAYNNPQKVKVNLKITKETPPQIWVNASSLAFNTRAGSNPSSQQVRIKNNGEGMLTYGITWDASWLSVSPGNGISSGAENIHSVSAQTSSLPQGTYNATISIADPKASNSPQHIQVSLDIGALPSGNEIWVSCNPSSGKTDTLVTIPISIRGNTREIGVFGLEFTFDSKMFLFQKVEKGNLTGNWAAVDGNEASSGVVQIGGFRGGGSVIPKGSTGTLAVVTLKVTGTSYADNTQSQVTIRSYMDDISGMNPQPATAAFTYKK